jgi:hypothetical protein
MIKRPGGPGEGPLSPGLSPPAIPRFPARPAGPLSRFFLLFPQIGFELSIFTPTSIDEMNHLELLRD